MICNENNGGFLVDELITDATKRRKQSDADNSGSPDADPLDQRKDEPPSHRAEKEMQLANTLRNMAMDMVKKFYKKLKHC